MIAIITLLFLALVLTGAIVSAAARKLNPAYPVKVTADETSAMIVDPSGKVFRKMYDQHGGAGSVRVGPVGIWIYRKQIREAIASTHA
jgi:hypothetical protein